MSKRQRPPTRTSMEWVVHTKPFGPNHFPTCSASVHTLKTRARGASNTRERTVSRSRDQAYGSAASADILLLLRRTGIGWGLRATLQLVQVGVEAIEALFPRTSRVLRPLDDVGQRLADEPA